MFLIQNCCFFFNLWLYHIMIVGQRLQLPHSPFLKQNIDTNVIALSWDIVTIKSFSCLEVKMCVRLSMAFRSSHRQHWASVRVFLSPLRGHRKNLLQRNFMSLVSLYGDQRRSPALSPCERGACTDRGRRSPFASIFGSEFNKNRTETGAEGGRGGCGAGQGNEFPPSWKPLLRSAARWMSVKTAERRLLNHSSRH